MAADFTDALLGYEFYLQRRGEASMDEVNAHLRQLRRPEISLRTYNHYRKLISHGFRSYVPINKFDVFRSLGKLQMAADRRRYARRNVDIKAKLTLDGENWIECTIIDISLVGFGIRSLGDIPVRPGTQVWLQMDAYLPIPAFVAWRKLEDETTRLGLRALEFIDHYRIRLEQPGVKRPSGLLIIHRHGDGEIDWKYLVYVLEVSTQLIEAAADLLVAVSEVTRPNLDMPRPVLRSIEFHSPGQAEIKVDLGIAEIIKVILDNVRNWGGQKKQQQEEVRRLALENDLRAIQNKQEDIKTAALQIELIRNALNMADNARTLGLKENVVQALLDKPLKTALQIEQLPDDLFNENSLERGIVEQRLLPAAVELTNGDDPSYEVTASTQDAEAEREPTNDGDPDRDGHKQQ